MALCVLFPRFVCFQTFSSPQCCMLCCVAQRERERERERGDDELLSRELANVLIFLLEEREVCFQSDGRVFCIAEEMMC